MVKNDVVLIDANVLLRYLLKDDERQYQEALKIIDNNTAFVLSNILQEVVYVLSGSIYNIPRDEIKKAIKASFEDIYYIDRPLLEKALDIFTEKPKLDFPDCLLVAYNQTMNINVFSFDKKLNNRLNNSL